MWIVRLTDKQLEVLKAMLRSEEHLGPALRGALEALELARWDELPDAQLPWESVIEEARSLGRLGHLRPPPRATRAARQQGAPRAGRRLTNRDYSS